jgi:hypothetical protein
MIGFSCYHFATQLGSTHENRAVRNLIALRINRTPMGGPALNRPSIGAPATRRALMAGFGQIEAQVMMVAMVAEATAVRQLVGCYNSNLHGFRRCSADRLWCCTDCSG